MKETYVSSTSIEDLPEELLQYILEHVPPYNDLKNCMLVSHAWYHHGKVVIQKRQQTLYRAICEMRFHWDEQKTELGPTVSKRYAHSACYHKASLYVFGGCTTMSTSFNDLWRLDLSTRRWVRPLAMGTYPSPKACATMVSYKDSLVLFGGWPHPVPHPHHAFRIYNELHMYDTVSNRWTQVDSAISPPSTAAHSASVVGNLMVVFGGLQWQLNGDSYHSSNQLWTFDLDKLEWKKQITTEPKPPARQGHSQVNIDDKHILVLGGCGGPNRNRKPFDDAWLLTLSTEEGVAWSWKELLVTCLGTSSPSQMWWHPACIVGDKVVVLNKSPKAYDTKTTGNSSVCCRIPRTWIPPRDDELEEVANQRARDVLSQRGETAPQRVAPPPESCVNGVQGSFRRRSDPEPVAGPSNRDEPGPSRPPPPEINNCDINNPVRNTPYPSVRPNSFKNRQRQLEGIQRMEEKLRHLRRNPQQPPAPSTRSPTGVRNPMHLYVLDVSLAVSQNYVTWLPVRPQPSNVAPEDCVLYSMVLGRGELIMFGGHQGNCNNDLSNTVFYISGKKKVV